MRSLGVFQFRCAFSSQETDDKMLAVVFESRRNAEVDENVLDWWSMDTFQRRRPFPYMKVSFAALRGGILWDKEKSHPSLYWRMRNH